MDMASQVQILDKAVFHFHEIFLWEKHENKVLSDNHVFFSIEDLNMKLIVMKPPVVGKIIGQTGLLALVWQLV